MRALVLGAGGIVGRAAAATLERRGRFDEVILSDIRRVTLSPGPHAAAITLDVTDEAALLAALREVDVVLNCTTYHFGLLVLRAAIEARTDYIDLGGLHNTPRQLAMGDEAAAAGVTAVLGCGATPGISNVLVAFAGERLGNLCEVEISFVSHRDLAPSPGLLDTILDEFRPDTDRYYWSEGSFIKVDPFSGEKRVRFPEPVEEAAVFYVPHSENHTLPRHIPGLRSVSVRGSWRASDMDLLRAMSRAGMTSASGVSVEGLTVRPLDVLKAVLLRGHRRSDDGCYFFLNVTARSSDGELEFLVSHPRDWGVEATGLMTGIPAAIGTEFLGLGSVSRKGVIAPEIAFDPEAFLTELEGEEIVARSLQDRPNLRP